MLVLPLSVLGMTAGHWLAYRVTGTSTGPYHGYVAHLPRVALVLLVLALAAAHFVERGGARLALWPFPAVALAGFVVQEHAERLEHTGSVPFLLTSRVFLVGLAVQLVVAVLAWVVARLLVVVAHVSGARTRLLPDWAADAALGGARLATAAVPLGVRSRAPPRGR
jgi:hypothetical protein